MINKGKNEKTEQKGRLPKKNKKIPNPTKASQNSKKINPYVCLVNGFNL